jgi:hypothetical protein
VNLTRLVDPATSRPLRFLLPPSYRSCPLFSDKGKQLRRQLSCRSSASLKRIHLAHSSPFGSKCDHCGEFGDTLECGYGSARPWLHRECQDAWRAEYDKSLSRFTSTCCGTPAATHWPMQGMTRGQFRIGLDIEPYNTPRATPNSARNDSKIFGAPDVSARPAVACPTRNIV